ncbi:MAG: DUF1634 domain-containing protein [Terriglobia bacterium]
MNDLTEDKARSAIAAILRYGSLISTLVMALGLIPVLLRGPVSFASGGHLVSFRTLFPRVARLDPAAIAEFGLLLLLVTPIFRIIVAGIAFGLEREYKYVLISLGVLAVVCGSIGLAVR